MPVRGWGFALQLALSSPALVRQPASARGGARASGAPAAGHSQGPLEALGEPLQGELPVARLRALVLGHRHKPRSGSREHAGALCLAERR